MNDEKLKFRAAILYEYKKGTNVAETLRNLHSVFGPDCIKKSLLYSWFKRFDSGSTSIEDEPRSGRPAELDDDRLRAKVESNPRVTARELSVDFGTSHTTIINHLRRMGFVSKLNLLDIQPTTRRHSRSMNPRQQFVQPT